MTATTTTWAAEPKDALGPDPVLLDLDWPEPGTVFRPAAATATLGS